MEAPDLNEIDRLRALRTIERLRPEMDMAPPYGEVAVRSIGRFMNLSRDFSSGEDRAANNAWRGAALRSCFDWARSELGLSGSEHEGLYVYTVLLDLSLLAAELVSESSLKERAS